MFLLPLISAERAVEMRESRARRVMRRAVPWPEAKPPKGRRDIGIIAESFEIENPMDLVFPDAPIIKTAEEEDKALYSGSKKLRYSKKIFPMLHGLPVTDAPDMWHDHGRAFFTGDVIMPTLEKREDSSNGSLREWKPWMSLTPNEVWTQRSGIRAATKRVVMGGLGMGYLLDQIARKKTVKDICVIENDAELISWYGQDLCYKLEEKHEIQIDILHDDIWRLARDFDKETRFLIDIWDSSSGALFDRELQKLRSEGYKVWAWGSPRGRTA